jgi:hypothetical protein
MGRRGVGGLWGELQRYRPATRQGEQQGYRDKKPGTFFQRKGTFQWTRWTCSRGRLVRLPLAQTRASFASRCRASLRARAGLAWATSAAMPACSRRRRRWPTRASSRCRRRSPCSTTTWSRGPVEVRMFIALQVPASWSQKKQRQALEGTVFPTTKPDVDNVGQGRLRRPQRRGVARRRPGGRPGADEALRANSRASRSRSCRCRRRSRRRWRRRRSSKPHEHRYSFPRIMKMDKRRARYEQAERTTTAEQRVGARAGSAAEW